MVDLAKKVQVSIKDVSNIEQFSIYAQNVSLSQAFIKYVLVSYLTSRNLRNSAEGPLKLQMRRTLPL